MTKYECCVVMAYTGVAMLTGPDFDIFHRYVEEKLGRPVWTHELASERLQFKIKEAAKEDFIDICKNATD